MAPLPALVTDHPLDDSTVARFREHGHVLVRGLAGAEEVAAYRSAISDATMRLAGQTRPLADRDTYGKAFLQVSNLWRQDEQVARFVLARRFASTAARLLGVDRVRLYHDQALYKEVGGGVTPWHQDSLYWPVDTDLTVTMWMPLVDVDGQMGGMSFASGSHRGGPLSDFAISDESEEYFERLLADGRYPVVEPLAMAAGDATFHAGWTLHRAMPNDGAAVREVMTIIYVADGVTVVEPRNDYQAKDLEKWLPGLAPGDPVAGELNPLLPV